MNTFAKRISFVAIALFAIPVARIAARTPDTRSESQISTDQQAADTVAVSLAVSTRFVDARSISVDPSGRFYVVDAARNTVTVFDKDLSEAGTFGGPGINVGQFDEPTDIDPTNGLVINIADAGNGRIQRYSKDFRFLESLPVPASIGLNATKSPSFRPGSERVQGLSDGRPTSVATSRQDDLFVIESGSNKVFRWDRDRRSTHVVGTGPNESEILRRPVDLVVSGDFLFVADSESNAVFIFDLFGIFQRRFMLEANEKIVGLTGTVDTVVAIFPSELRWYSLGGRHVRSVVPVIPDGEAIVDAAVTVDVTFILTRQNLFSISQHVEGVH